MRNALIAVGLALVAGQWPGPPTAAAADRNVIAGTTPIKYVVVIYPENRSFDHYFGTYPVARNLVGESAFTAKAGTPSVNGLGNAPKPNPNGVEPFRIPPTALFTCGPSHTLQNQQGDYNGGRNDSYLNFSGASISPSTCPDTQPQFMSYATPALTMGYYDGNTVTAMWNYAQNYALSDAHFESQFGPSTIGALNLASGRTTNASVVAGAPSSGVTSTGTLYNDLDPAYDACSSAPTSALTGANIGDLLNARGITWGWFQGGFAPSSGSGDRIKCNTAHNNIFGVSTPDYVPHHAPFQYYPQTSNPNHVAPASVDKVGVHGDAANHNYDLSWFWAAANAGNLPQVSFLKPPQYQNGHAGNSHPLSEQTFLVETINALQALPEWDSMVIFIARDDVGGWYDHVMPEVVNFSSAFDFNLPGTQALIDNLFTRTGGFACFPRGTAPVITETEGRCGPGGRMPLLAISPYAKVNYVDSTPTIQTSMIRFIEDNWGLGRLGGGSFDAAAGPLTGMFDFTRKSAGTLTLDPTTGEVVGAGDTQR